MRFDTVGIENIQSGGSREKHSAILQVFHIDNLAADAVGKVEVGEFPAGRIKDRQTAKIVRQPEPSISVGTDWLDDEGPVKSGVRIPGERPCSRIPEVDDSAGTNPDPPGRILICLYCTVMAQGMPVRGVVNEMICISGRWIVEKDAVPLGGNPHQAIAILHYVKGKAYSANGSFRNDPDAGSNCITPSL